jgi:hypothetical protein
MTSIYDSSTRPSAYDVYVATMAFKLACLWMKCCVMNPTNLTSMLPLFFVNNSFLKEFVHFSWILFKNSVFFPTCFPRFVEQLVSASKTAFTCTLFVHCTLTCFFIYYPASTISWELPV